AGPAGGQIISSNGVIYTYTTNWITTTITNTLQFTVSDGVTNSSTNVTVTLYPTNTPSPVAGITNPADGVTITAPTNIIGTAGSPILQSRQVRYRLAPPSAADDSSTEPLAGQG